MQDMQLLMDVCPLRVDSVFLREAQDSDFASAATTTTTTTTTTTKAAVQREQVAAVMCISVLDINQPVHITESEVVRVKKRSRGVLFTSVFGSGRSGESTKPAAAL
jgi:hypothetical protein